MHDLMARKPIMVKAEGVNPVGFGDLSLLSPGLLIDEIIVPDIGMGLLDPMALKDGLPVIEQVPFGESLAPNSIILWDRMVLWQIKGYELDLVFIN